MAAHIYDAAESPRLRSLLGALGLTLTSMVAALAVAIVLVSGRPSLSGEVHQGGRLTAAPSVAPTPASSPAVVARPLVAHDVITYVIVAPAGELSLAALLAAAGDRRVATGSRPAEVFVVSFATDAEATAFREGVEQVNLDRLAAGLTPIDVLDLRTP